MTQVDKQALREAAVAAKTAGETQDYYRRTNALNAFMGRAKSDVVIALLDELEAKDKQIEDLKEAFNIALSATGIDTTRRYLRERGVQPMKLTGDHIGEVSIIKVAIGKSEARYEKFGEDCKRFEFTGEIPSRRIVRAMIKEILEVLK